MPMPALIPVSSGLDAIEVLECQFRFPLGELQACFRKSFKCDDFSVAGILLVQVTLCQPDNRYQRDFGLPPVPILQQDANLLRKHICNPPWISQSAEAGDRFS
ncbi:hypothetical protein D9M70_520630 [compost metagenome]